MLRLRRRRVGLLSLAALSLLTFAPGPSPATAQEERIRQIDAMIRQDLQGPLFTESMGPVECRDGFAGPFPCKNVDLLSFTTIGELGGGTGNDIWGWTDPLTGKEYAIVGLGRGTTFVDISTPTDPVVLGILPTHTNASFWRDMKVFKDHAFIVADLSGAHGMQVFDLRQLRGLGPTDGLRQFRETAHYAGFGNAHNVAINEATGFAYAVGSNTCAGGLHMVDINDSRNPTFAGCFEDEGYTHDVQCVVYQGPDRRFRGREICFAANPHVHDVGNAVSIVDVTDKSRPVLLGRAPYEGSAFSHQGWLTEDHAYFLHNDELDEMTFGHNTRTRFFDVKDLTNPFLDFFVDLRTPAIDHNLYIVGKHVFETNYRAGLQILKMDIPRKRAPEVAYFDIFPPDDLTQFNGAWSNYPFFSSGVVVVNGIEEGLFVLKPRLDGGGGGGRPR